MKGSNYEGQISSISWNVFQLGNITDAFDGSPVLDLKGDFFEVSKQNTQ
jgi:hypothetical protein